ncbi:acyl-CoA N-acyltransferase [Parathielavia appendiculata]|uniref:Acyl-CoA N-acyltransferase n=1 Tax=Parathielavia appendiculata TaxID=2587402 RepID=A0AAN6U2X5_9PEZI|nr:acyl-CoA N-acyltransferase [Parathielavia appendiculata]
MAFWSSLSSDQIGPLLEVADQVHPDLPESAHVFAERVRLFPEGCLGLVRHDDGKLCGYAISHPIRAREPPALDSLLGEIAPDADQYYIHDVAVLPGFRGKGLAAEVIRMLIEVAWRHNYRTTCLVSVYGTAPFWARFGFVSQKVGAALAKKLKEYGEDAVYMSCQAGR